MAKESQSKISKREQMKNTKTQLRKKKNESSDSDSDSNNSSSEEDIDTHEYRKFLGKIFPSNHLNNKIKSGEKLKKVLKEDKKNNSKSRSKKEKQIDDESEDWETTSDDEQIVKKPKRNLRSLKNNKKQSKKQSKHDDESNNSESDSENEEDEISLGTVDTNSDDNSSPNEYSDNESDKNEDDDNERDDNEDEYEDDNKNKKYGKNKLNIIFTIGGSKNIDDDEWSSESDYDSDYEEPYQETEDENSSVSSVESDKKNTRSKTKKEINNKNNNNKNKNNNNNNNNKNKNNNNNDDNIDNNKNNNDKNIDNNTDNDNKNFVSNEEQREVLKNLKELLEKNPKDKSIQKCIETYESDIRKQEENKKKKDKKTKDKNMRIFRKILRDKNTNNDFTFYEKLDIENQKKIISELREINKITRIEKPYRITLLESKIPVQYKASAIKKINSLRYMEPGSGEYYKIKNWVDTFMRIPFNKYEELPVSIESGVEKCHDFMENAQKILDQAVYGLNDAKMQIMQMLGQLITNPKAIGTAIAIHGPPGSGKTSLVKEGISKILNRPFTFIALGGATDSSFLEGHGYTYEGSTWGKIVQILIDSNCMNPVIYFDELDKISETPKGEEIAGILTHLTDTTQNSQFHDKYFSEIDFDLSKCLFIFSYNDESKVNPILKDRMYRIKTKGYSCKEKTIIANNYLLPRIRDQVKFVNGDIVIPDDVISYINETHCHKEDGVRNMKRCLEIIHTKLNLYRLMRPGSNLFEGEMSLKVEFPFKVTKEVVDKLIKRETDLFSSALYSMYV